MRTRSTHSVLLHAALALLVLLRHVNRDGRSGLGVTNFGNQAKEIVRYMNREAPMMLHLLLAGPLLALVYCPAFGAAGSNGMALTPPLTWRSWNQFGWYIQEDVILSAARGLVDTSRPIKNRPAGTSLRDLGYNEVGMDEGWAACPPQPGPHPHGRDPRVDPRAQPRQNVTSPFPIGDNQTSMYHRLNSDGTISPVVDDILFPDMKRLVDNVHQLGLRAGWYPVLANEA